MVYPDFSFIPKSSEEETPRLASVADRLLAFFIDFLIFSPVLGFCVSLVLKRMRTLIMVDGDSPEAGVLWALLVVAVISLGVLFESLFVYFRGGTPGQIFMQLQVRSWPRSERLDFMQVLNRTLLWWAFTPFVLPLLSVYTHPLRRALHDRASETLLVTLKQQGDPGPIEVERNFFLSWSKFLLLAILLLGAISLMRVQTMLGEGYFTRVVLEEEGLLCENLKMEATQAGRLDRALAMFVAGSAGSDCLEREADLVLWSAEKELHSFAYLAKGMISVHTDLAEDYYKRACELDKKGEACAIAKFSTSKEKDRAKVLRKVGLSSITARLMLLKESISLKEWASAAGLIKDLRIAKGFDEELNREEVRVVWKMRDSATKGRRPASSEQQEILRDFEERYQLR